MLWRIILILLISVQFAHAESCEDLNKYESFAFANEAGTRLLSIVNDSYGISYRFSPERITHAICPHGKVLKVKYLKYQEQGEKNNGRATARNFDNFPGHLFEIIDGTTEKDASCLLTDQQMIEELPVQNITEYKNHRCDDNMIRKVTQATGSTVFDCGFLAETSSGYEISIVQYVPMNRIGFVLGSSEGVVIGGYQGYRAVDGDMTLRTWNLDIILVRGFGDNIQFAYSWFGEEGIFLEILVKDGDGFKCYFQSGRYTLL